MNAREKTIVIRSLFVLTAILLTAGVIALVTVLNTDASYPVPLEPNEASEAETEEAGLEVSPMPEDA